MNIFKTLTFVGISFLGYSQNSSSRYQFTVHTESNIDRYNVDYVIKDYVFVNGDSTILENIDFSLIENQRKNDENVEVIDPTTGLTVVLFNRPKNIVQ